MSTSLVKKSLELFKDDFNDTEGKKKKAKNPMKLISTKRKGVKRELRKLKKQQEYEKNLKLNKKKSKSALEDMVHQKKQSDKIDKNLHVIKKFSKFSSTNSKVAESIIKHQRGNLSKDNPVEEEEKEVQKSILFSDTDFDKEVVKDNFWD